VVFFLRNPKFEKRITKASMEIFALDLPKVWKEFR
jgi:hypothetical protein